MFEQDSVSNNNFCRYEHAEGLNRRKFMVAASAILTGSLFTEARAMNNKFKKILQIGLIVDDAEAFAQRYEQDFGVGPWEMIDFPPSDGRLSGMLVNGKPSPLKLKIAFYRSFEIEMELIQPISESVFMDWLRKNGSGIHHVGFALNEDYDTFIENYKRTGKKPWIEVTNGDHTEGFAYLDFRKELGLILEVHKGKPG